MNNRRRAAWIAASLVAVSLSAVGCSHDNDHHHHKHHSSDATLAPTAPVAAMTPGEAAAAAPMAPPLTAMNAPVAVPVSITSKVVTAGEPMTVTSAAVPVSEVLANPDKYTGQTIKIEGNVTSVCAKKGCWARLSDDKTPKGQDLFVKFTCPEEEGGRVLPMAVQGNKATVQGVVKVGEISEAQARHYAKDAGLPAAEADKIVGPQRQISVMSPSVSVEIK